MKNKYIVTLFVVTSVAVLSFFAFLFYDNITLKYSTYDCVTYFDEDGRYQLCLSAGSYYFWDAAIEKPLTNSLNYYLFEDDTVYMIYDEWEGTLEDGDYKRKYAVFTLQDEVFTSKKTTDELPVEFVSQESMIDLTVERSAFSRWIAEFIPYKYRKW